LLFNKAPKGEGIGRHPQPYNFESVAGRERQGTYKRRQGPERIPSQVQEHAIACCLALPSKGWELWQGLLACFASKKATLALFSFFFAKEIKETSIPCDSKRLPFDLRDAK